MVYAMAKGFAAAFDAVEAAEKGFVCSRWVKFGKSSASLRSASTRSGGIFDVSSLERRAAELAEKSAMPDFWQDPDNAQKLLKERAAIQSTLDAWKRLAGSLGDGKVFLEVASEGDEAEAKTTEIEQFLGEMELRQMLGGEHDAGNAIVTVHPGAGGTEAQDWAEMLLRMYLRWAERRGFETELVDLQPGEGGGIKNATFTVNGPYAYGYLQAEGGIHRLVRISPFDANARRHTSFASVFVYPEIEDEIEVDIRDEDLRVDTYRSSGAGGQHVNKTDSAVRLTHLPTGIVVACQNERSQHKNRAMAMKILRARLYELEMEKQREKMTELTKGKKDISFGSQIRSYVLHPYRLVKDLRTGVEVGNTDAVLDGDIDRFIQAYLLKKIAA
jgi:peptide chain release factor 2